MADGLGTAISFPALDRVFHIQNCTTEIEKQNCTTKIEKQTESTAFFRLMPNGRMNSEATFKEDQLGAADFFPALYRVVQFQLNINELQSRNS